MSVSKQESAPSHEALLQLPARVTSIPRGVVLATFFFLAVLSAPLAASEADPWESVNRQTHTFNRGVDRLLLRPVAATYQKLAPRIVRRGVSNFFANLADVRSSVNHVLQLEFGQAANSLGRVVVNSSVGLGGLLEIADPALGLRRSQEDFGLTLAHYGFGSGPYLVLPFLGPSTLRDAFGIGFDNMLDPINQVQPARSRNAVRLAQITDFRTGLLGFDALVIGDDYLFYREAYLQRRDAATGMAQMDLAFDSYAGED